MRKIYWLPRILSILFIGFISVFALDVFTATVWLTALLMHLTPSLILIIITIVAWKKGFLGGIIFILLGIVLALTLFSWVIFSPLMLIGLLFLLTDKK